jgi:hypothetical protein
MAGVTFTDSGAAKIKKAVNIVLGTPGDRNRERTRSHVTDTFFWGMLLGSDITGKRFHFVKVYPDASADQADFHLTNGQSYIIAETEAETGFAREANGNPGVPPYTVALMQFVGYDADGEPAYMFQCSIGTPQDWVLPPHDHRDNYNGWFAFSVYHPGTALPQQPWAM